MKNNILILFGAAIKNEELFLSKGYERKHIRTTVMHLKYIYLKIVERNYPVIDISLGGMSLVDHEENSGLRVGLIIKGVTLDLIAEHIQVDVEVVFHDSHNHIYGLKIVKYHGSAKSNLEKFTNWIEKGKKLDNVSFHMVDNDWILKTPEVIIGFEGDRKAKILEKPFLMSKKQAFYLALGIISGLDRDIFPGLKFVQAVTNEIY